MFYIARLSVVMLSVIYPGCHALYCPAECSYAERHLSIVSHFLYCHAECHYAECHYAECRGTVNWWPKNVSSMDWLKYFTTSKILAFNLIQNNWLISSSLVMNQVVNALVCYTSSWLDRQVSQEWLGQFISLLSVCPWKKSLCQLPTMSGWKLTTTTCGLLAIHRGSLASSFGS